MNNSTNNPKRFRFRYFIDKPFQTKFILRFVLVILLGLTVTMGILAYYSQTKFQEGIYLKYEKIDTITKGGVPQAVPKKIMTFNRLQLFWRPVVFVSVFYMVLLIIFGLFYSHRMAGPLYRIQKNLQGFIEGDDLKDIRIRKNDHFQELVTLLNQLLIEKEQK